MDCPGRLPTIWKVIILIALCTSVACSKVDIDYSHSVKGTGTIMTDYRIGDRQKSEAFGTVRGTGEVMDSSYFSTNNSSDLRVEDRFILTKTAEKAMTMSVQPSLPRWPGGTGSYRLIGKAWAEKIGVASQGRGFDYPL